jgi:tetratricopeptide (TPR) repeat protein
MSRSLSPLRGLLTGLLLATLTACASTDEESLVDDTRPAADIFAEAEQLFEERNFAEAVTLYDDVERLHPYSPLAKPAMLRSAQASYEAGNYEEARLAAERFLNFYPADRDAAQAQYIVALSHYDQMADVGRDQGETRKALDAVGDLALAGGAIRGAFLAERGGHDITNRLLRALMSDPSAYRWVTEDVHPLAPQEDTALRFAAE